MRKTINVCISHSIWSVQTELLYDGRIICPEKQWHRYSLEDLMTKYQWYFAPQKLKRKKRKVCFNSVRQTLHYCGGHKWNKQPQIHMKRRKLSCLANDKHGANYAVRASCFFRLTTVSSNNRNLNSNDIASYVINVHLATVAKIRRNKKISHSVTVFSSTAAWTCLHSPVDKAQRGLR